ncbi:MAG: mechanosensitive ion channel domain-containing protein [Bacteroidota bacterium]
MDQIDVNAIWEKVYTLGVEYLPKVALALLTLIIGFWIIGRITNLVKKALDARGMDPSLKSFLASMVSVVLKVMLLISAAGMVGIETTSFAVILGSAGLAVGLALQGSLSNFAGGVLILLFRPFKVGDLIEAQGFLGVVKAINLLVTTIVTPDNKTVILPNAPLSGDSITNYSTLDKLRVDLVVGISYDANIKQAKDIIMETVKKFPGVMQDPAPTVAVSELADSSVNLVVRPFSSVADYWDVYFGVTEAVKVALDDAGIEIPFPQRVIHEAKA